MVSGNVTRRVVAICAAVLAAGCVSKQDASNAAIRVLNAVPDGPRIDVYLDDVLQVKGLDYGVGSPYAAPVAGTRQIRLDELLPSNADADSKTIYDESTSLAVADELSLVLLGSAAAETQQVVAVRTTTRGVPTGKSRIQFIHASVGAAPVDVYVTAPGGPIAGATPFATALAFGAATPQQDLPGGNAEVVVTAAGNPAAVLLDSGNVFLPLQGTLLIGILQNTAADAAMRPFFLAVLTGSGSGIVTDQGMQANLRFANASPGSYTLDAFLNATAESDSARQVCDPATVEEATTLELCAVPFGAVGNYKGFAPGTYDVKLQVTGNDALPAQTITGSFAAGTENTLLPLGLVPDGATSMGLILTRIIAGRRVATAAQLRIVQGSIAAPAAVAGDPTTDRLELYISDPAVALADDEPDYTGLQLGFDTGYVALLAGSYRVTLAKTDTAVADAVPQPLFTQLVSLAGDGIYTLVITDSVGGVQPLQSLSLDDDPTSAP